MTGELNQDLAPTYAKARAIFSARLRTGRKGSGVFPLHICRTGCQSGKTSLLSHWLVKLQGHTLPRANYMRST